MIIIIRWLGCSINWLLYWPTFFSYTMWTHYGVFFLIYILVFQQHICPSVTKEAKQAVYIKVASESSIIVQTNPKLTDCRSYITDCSVRSTTISSILHVSPWFDMFRSTLKCAGSVNTVDALSKNLFYMWYVWQMKKRENVVIHKIQRCCSRGVTKTQIYIAEWTSQDRVLYRSTAGVIWKISCIL